MIQECFEMLAKGHNNNWTSSKTNLMKRDLLKIKLQATK